ncbi:hypothetical protein BO78DRAFT_191860 [Aspergillus sclerotiicarbonarius CBS 121057]|uniref:Uncharacterized protein n=1 Tax=Aspergillus sclerotiicarbonarius (strain CBS 121057 / IBT 28362) TaxID=1448318 RepID=A0A319E2N3_ASPSB|nr:hypothetical protein BO78DRAFT_191860 [Aspergillus sclerotiicarbonarius CBS 121057]
MTPDFHLSPPLAYAGLILSFLLRDQDPTRWDPPRLFLCGGCCNGSLFCGRRLLFYSVLTYVVATTGGPAACPRAQGTNPCPPRRAAYPVRTRRCPALSTDSVRTELLARPGRGNNLPSFGVC